MTTEIVTVKTETAMVKVQPDAEQTLEKLMEIANAKAASATEKLEEANEKARDAVEDALECGAALCRAKELVGHGKWLPYLRANFRHGKKSTAEEYMWLHRNRTLAEPEGLSIRQFKAKILEAKNGGAKPKRTHHAAVIQAELDAQNGIEGGHRFKGRKVYDPYGDVIRQNPSAGNLKQAESHEPKTIDHSDVAEIEVAVETEEDRAYQEYLEAEDLPAADPGAEVFYGDSDGDSDGENDAAYDEYLRDGDGDGDEKPSEIEREIYSKNGASKFVSKNPLAGITRQVIEFSDAMESFAGEYSSIERAMKSATFEQLKLLAEKVRKLSENTDRFREQVREALDVSAPPLDDEMKDGTW